MIGVNTYGLKMKGLLQASRMTGKNVANPNSQLFIMYDFCRGEVWVAEIQDGYDRLEFFNPTSIKVGMTFRRMSMQEIADRVSVAYQIYEDRSFSFSARETLVPPINYSTVNRYCRYCGNQLSGANLFCPYCGQQLV